MLLSGALMPAAELADTALFARVVEGDAIEAAIKVALAAAASGRRLRLRDVTVEHPDAQACLAGARAAALAPAQLPAPARWVDTLAASLLPVDAGLQEEGIAARAGDIDAIYLSGCGFPTWRGGSIHYAGQIGLPKVYDRLPGERLSWPGLDASGALTAAGAGRRPVQRLMR